jgi:hypothetical protein
MTSTSLPRYCLIACSRTKAPVAAPAASLYRGDLFQKSLTWAQREDYTEVAILSARHGVVPLHQVVEPYDDSLTTATMLQRRRWAAHVLATLQEHWLAEACEVTFMAGRRYTEPLVALLMAAAPRTQVRRPLAGLGIGQQKAWLAHRLRLQGGATHQNKG